ncbi:MAG: hypothetical protein AAF547_20805 [Actinomycetota bacterium]
MSRTVRTLAAAVIAVALVGIGPIAVPAAAARAGAPAPDVPPPRTYGESGSASGSVTVSARAEWLPAGSEGSGGDSSCTTSSVEIAVEDDFVQPVNDQWRYFGADGSIPFAAAPDDLPASLPTVMRQFSPTGRWYGVSCDGDIAIVPEGGPAVTIAGLVQEALDQVTPTEPELVVTPEDLHFAQLQSWLAVDAAYWDLDRTAVAAAGRVVVTAEVDPLDTLWEMGDGESVLCEDGPGTPWAPGLDDDAADCAYTYRQSSAGAPGDAFEITATVRFGVEVTTNAPGTYGPFDDIEVTTPQVIQVGEIQAVND